MRSDLPAMMSGHGHEDQDDTEQDARRKLLAEDQHAEEERP